MRSRVGELYDAFVRIAPAPSFRRIISFGDRVLRLSIMFARMLIRRLIATADVTAVSAKPQMYPPAS